MRYPVGVGRHWAWLAVVLTALPDAGRGLMFTQADLRLHGSPNDCWMALNGAVWDMSAVRRPIQAQGWGLGSIGLRRSPLELRRHDGHAPHVHHLRPYTAASRSTRILA